MYRMHQATQPQYREKLQKSLSDFLAKKGLPGDFSVANFAQFDLHHADTEYVRLIAGIDMFLNRFPNHKLADARIGTIPTRGKDQAALMDIGLIKKQIGMNLGAIGRWIWCKELFDDINRMSKLDEEVDVEHSYVHYMIEMGLSQRSPYSTTVNTSFHYWTHVIGCCRGLERSKNARFMGDVNTSSLANSAILLAFALQRYTNSRMYYNATGQPKLAIEVDADEEEDALEGIMAPKYPVGVLGDDWYDWLQDKEGLIPDQVMKYFQPTFALYSKSRDNSMAKHLYETYGQKHE